MQIAPGEYQEFRAWLGRVTREVFPSELLSAQADPLAALDAMAETSPANARKGLMMALGDVVELTSGLPEERVAALDRGLLDEGLPTLSSVRARFSKVIQRVVRRGRINDEVEYHSVRNAAELGGGAQEQLWQLLASYEGRATS